MSRAPGTLPVTIDDVLAARERLEGVATRTPLDYSRALSEKAGHPVHLKCENLQRAGSFKIRGAYNQISQLSPEQKAAGVVAASAGNHAQGVALAAQLLGVSARIYMPFGASLPKLTATRAYGADVRFHGSTVDEALEEATRYSESNGAVLVHPFDHGHIIAGQGTVGLEILEQCPDVDTIVVGAGGGGLLAGIALVARHLEGKLGRRIRLVGVQAEQAAAYPLSLEADEVVPAGRMSTMADGIAIARPGRIPFQVVRELVDEVVTVSEESIAQALVFLMERAKTVVEPAGAVTAAALMEGKVRSGGTTVAVLSGGNIDPSLLLKVVRRGLVVAGRFLNFSVRLPDKPGSLVAVSQKLAELGANVMEVEHRRDTGAIAIGQVEIVFRVETRGTDHAEEILDQLRREGHEPIT